MDARDKTHNVEENTDKDSKIMSKTNKAIEMNVISAQEVSEDTENDDPDVKKDLKVPIQNIPFMQADKQTKDTSEEIKEDGTMIKAQEVSEDKENDDADVKKKDLKVPIQNITFMQADKQTKDTSEEIKEDGTVIKAQEVSEYKENDDPDVKKKDLKVPIQNISFMQADKQTKDTSEEIKEDVTVIKAQEVSEDKENDDPDVKKKDLKVPIQNIPFMQADKQTKDTSEEIKEDGTVIKAQEVSEDKENDDPDVKKKDLKVPIQNITFMQADKQTKDTSEEIKEDGTVIKAQEVSEYKENDDPDVKKKDLKVPIQNIPFMQADKQTKDTSEDIKDVTVIKAQEVSEDKENDDPDVKKKDLKVPIQNIPFMQADKQTKDTSEEIKEDGTVIKAQEVSEDKENDDPDVKKKVLKVPIQNITFMQADKHTKDTSEEIKEDVTVIKSQEVSEDKENDDPDVKKKDLKVPIQNIPFMQADKQTKDTSEEIKEPEKTGIKIVDTNTSTIDPIASNSQDLGKMTNNSSKNKKRPKLNFKLRQKPVLSFMSQKHPGRMKIPLGWHETEKPILPPTEPQSTPTNSSKNKKRPKLNFKLRQKPVLSFMSQKHPGRMKIPLGWYETEKPKLQPTQNVGMDVASSTSTSAATSNENMESTEPQPTPAISANSSPEASDL